MISTLFYTWLVLLILTVADIKGHIYWTSNKQFLCKRHLPLLKCNELAKLQEGVSCKSEKQSGGSNQCRNRQKNTERKEGLWWTLPIPPMEVDGLLENKPIIKLGLALAEKPQSSSSREGVISSTTSAARRSSTTSLPNSSLQRSNVSPASSAKPKGEARSSSSTMKINAVTTLAGLVSSSTAQSSSAPSPKEKSSAKIAQVQKLQSQPANVQQHSHAHQHHQHQGSVNAYSQCSASNKANNAVSSGNKSVTLIKSSASSGKAIPAKHVANKIKPCIQAGQDLMNLINPLEASNDPYLQEYIQQHSVDRYSLPYSGDFHDQAYKSDEDLFKDNFPEKAYLANVQLRKNFNSNEAELGGGGYVGNAIFSDSRLASQQVDLDNSWATLSADERDKRNTFDNLMYQTMFNDTIIS